MTTARKSIVEGRMRISCCIGCRTFKFTPVHPRSRREFDLPTNLEAKGGATPWLHWPGFRLPAALGGGRWLWVLSRHLGSVQLILAYGPFACSAQGRRIGDRGAHL